MSRMTYVKSILLSFLISYCVSSSSFAVESKTFTLRLTGEPETLDWNRAHTPIETYLLMNIMDGLVSLDKDLKTQPALAESWKISRDGKTYTFKIRKNVKWSDGVELKAKDFLDSWKRLLTPGTAAAYAYFLYDIEGAEEFNHGANSDFSKVAVTAPDEHTLVVKLKEPVQHWIYIPSFWVTFPIRDDLVKKYGSKWTDPGKMVTLGPFTLESHQLESKIVLKANPNYYSTHGNIGQVNARIVTDDTTALNLYDSGQIDFLTDLTVFDANRWNGKKDFHAFPYLKTVFLGVVTDQYATANPKLRKKIAQSIDRSKLPSLLRGGQEMAYSFVPPKMMGFSKEIGHSFSKQRNDLQGDLNTSLSLALPNHEKGLTIAQFIQNELKTNLGLTVTLNPYDNKSFRAQLDLRSNPLFIMSWSADFPAPDNFLSVFQSRSGNNRNGWKNADFDDGVRKARYLPKKDQREKLYRKLQKMLLEDHTVILPLYYEPNLALIKDRVKGLELNPLNYLNLRKVILE